MEFLNQNMQLIITAAIVLLVLVILLGVWRAFSPRIAGGRRGQRLGISEYYEVDKERRLVLVRRDNVEHLILIGGPQDIMIETVIGGPTVGSAGYAPGLGRDPGQPGMARPAPRAPVFKTEPIGKASDAAPTPPPIRTREEPEL